jgi:hypothetical protein
MDGPTGNGTPSVRRRFTPISHLSARYNGFTLGAFAAVARLPFASTRYAFLRGRIQDFGRDAGIELRLPAKHARFSVEADAHLARVTEVARRLDAEMGDFVTLGAAASLWAINAPALTRARSGQLRARWWPHLSRYGLIESRYEEWISTLPKPSREARRNRTAMPINTQEALTVSSGLLAMMLEGVRAEIDTCFVAMPFRSPFVGRFAKYYMPALRGAGIRALRAWGGVTSEEHYMTLITLISRCGGILADVTGGNRNVMHEIGIIHGLGKPAYLFAERRVSKVPANLSHIPVIAYDPRRSGWERAGVTKAAQFIRWMRRDYLQRVKAYSIDLGVSASSLLWGIPRVPPFAPLETPPK